MPEKKEDRSKHFLELLKYIHESNLVKGIDDPQADADGQKAWEYLRDSMRARKAFDHLTIQRLQELITASQDMSGFWRGVYRDRNRVNVTVGGREVTKPENVLRAMDEWLELYSTRSAFENHVAFEKIHPFADGNGRTGRMLMWYQEYREGQKPTLIRNADKQEYYTWFE